jgi:hypothetical protein
VADAETDIAAVFTAFEGLAGGEPAAGAAAAGATGAGLGREICWSVIWTPNDVAAALATIAVSESVSVPDGVDADTPARFAIVVSAGVEFDGCPGEAEVTALSVAVLAS